MIALAWLSLITMLLLSLVYLQTVICFTAISPLPRNMLPMPPTDMGRQISHRDNFKQRNVNVMKGQRREKSFALGVGFGGGGGMTKKSPGGFGGGGGLGSNSMGKSAFG
jgi:hypothetical protein